VSGVVLQSNQPSIAFSETDQGVDAKNWVMVADSATFQLQARSDAYAITNTVFDVTRAGVMRVNSQVVWTAGNDGAGSGLDADLLDGQHGSFYLDLGNSTGILPVSRGGTGSSAGLVTGGVLYGSSPSLVATTSAGSAGQLFRSNGGAAPSWIDQSTLSVATAVTANFASTAGSATTASNVPWTGVTGLGAFGTALQTVGGLGNATTTAHIRPSYYFDMGSNLGVLSMRPTEFPTQSITGWGAYGSSDMGSYQTGLTVTGSGGSYSLQIAANWNFEEGAPTGLRYRVNDDTSTTNAWGAFQTLWDSGNFNPGSYVAKSGDTMTGGLFVPSIAVGSVSMPATGGINTSGNITAFGFISSLSNITSNGGNFITSTGYMQAGNNSGGTGYMRVSPSGSGNSGILEFYPGNNIRGGYIGNTGAPGSTDGAGINYVAAFHAFSGNMTVTGSIVANGNITAFSDRRLKSNIAPITDALYKVQRLEGVTFNRKGSEERATGLIAQDVEAVLPEAVVTDTDGMKSVAYGNMVGLLVEAIKEQQEQIAELKAMVSSLLRAY
jgi:hypothetical protein